MGPVIDHQDRTSRKQNALGPITVDHAGITKGASRGLRPGRPAGRLEAETVEGAVVVHNYGHGGEGVMLSWGCAAEAVDLLTE